MATKEQPAQEQIEDKMIVHGVNMERVKAGQSRDVRRFLNDLARDVSGQLIKNDIPGAKRMATQQARLEKTIKQVDAMIADYYKDIFKDQSLSDFEVADLEQKFILDLYNGVIGVDIFQPGMTTEQMRALVKSTTIDATSTRECWSEQDQKTKKDFKREMRVGVAQGETTAQLVKRIKDKGGWIDKRKNEAEALVRTEIAQVMNDARAETYKANEDLIEAMEHSSELDSRTTLICISRDGLRWTFPGLKPKEHAVPYLQPPLHFRCRSVMLAVLVDYNKIFGTKGKFSIDNFEKKLREKIPQRDKESDEAFERRIKNQVDRKKSELEKGEAGNQKTVEKFLKENPVRARQVMGKTAANLFLDGKINLKQTIDLQSGRPLSVKELTKKYGYPDKDDKKKIQSSEAGKTVKTDMTGKTK